MADISGLGAEMDFSKLKVPDLKKELKSRGLTTAGNKNELIERLQASFKSTERTSNDSVEDLDEDLLNDDDYDVHLETSESVISDIDTALNDTLPTPKSLKRKSKEPNSDHEEITTIKKVVLNRNTPILNDAKVLTESKDDDKTDEASEEKKIIKLSDISAKERLEMRSKKFDVTLSADARKAVRAERFGTVLDAPTKITANVEVNSELLKKRADRFGGSVLKDSAIDQEKLEKRKARFGIVTPEDKAKQRLERFKLPVK